MGLNAPSPMSISQNKKKQEIDLGEIDERFNKYFEGMNAANTDDAMLADEEPMRKTSNLDGLDLDLSQS